MNILIHRISPDGSTYTGTEEPEILELEGDRFSRRIQPLHYRLFAERVGRELIVRGTVSARMELQCARCAEFFSTTVTDSSFLRAYDIPEGTESVDITPDLREAVLLLLPRFPICREGCAGLCPHCGANLNLEQCNCAACAGDARWGALDALDLN